MEQGHVQGFLVEWIMGPYNTLAGFISSVVPAAQSKFWEDRWSWDGASWFLHRLCRLRPWVIIKCPICLSEYFWKIPLGSPIGSCIGCRFSQANVNEDDTLRGYMRWAQQFTNQESDQRSDDVASHALDAEVYEAVCAGLPDAVMGKKSPGNTASVGA